MKLQCQIEVVNRLHANLNVKQSGKYLKSTLALGKEPNCSTQYCILLFSSSNKSGTKYRVKCIQKVFVKCIHEGKATIRFEDPPHDLCIKSEAIQLKSFMRLLRSCIAGDTKNLKLAPLSSVSIAHKDSPPTKLVIRDRSEFPDKGFSRTLESLHINGLKLCNFRRDILLLKQLVILDLGNNAIEKIPPEFGRMPNLKELYLTNNQLGTKGEVDWRWMNGPQITGSLKLLDISGNNLQYITKSIWKLHNLVTLKIDDNLLTQIPVTLGRMTKLRYLTMTKNKLASLPCSLLQCRLESLDLSENPLNARETCLDSSKYTAPWDLYIGSLRSMAAKVVIKKKINYAPNIIPWTLVEFLDNANMCVCGAPVLNDQFHMYKEFHLRDCFRVVVFNGNSQCTATFQCYFCSPKCFKLKL